MTETTPLDQAHAAMVAAGDDDAARLRFYERLADSELFLLLAEEAQGDVITPEMFDIADGRFVLVFDREARLAEFVGKTAPYAALSGRSLVAMLAPQGIGLGVNLEVAPSSILIPADAVSWLNDTLGQRPEELDVKPEAVEAPKGLPQTLLTALDAKLATARGLAQAAYLVGVRYDGGGRGHLLGFVAALPQAERALTQAVNEALTFSGIEAGVLDVAFFGAGDRILPRLAQVGLRFDLPQVVPEAPSAPGSDPDRPPRLR
jgi:hypothetical protein